MTRHSIEGETRTTLPVTIESVVEINDSTLIHHSRFPSGQTLTELAFELEKSAFIEAPVSLLYGERLKSARIDGQEVPASSEVFHHSGTMFIVTEKPEIITLDDLQKIDPFGYAHVKAAQEFSGKNLRVIRTRMGDFEPFGEGDSYIIVPKPREQETIKTTQPDEWDGKFDDDNDNEPSESKVVHPPAISGRTNLARQDLPRHEYPHEHRNHQGYYELLIDLYGLKPTKHETSYEREKRLKIEALFANKEQFEKLCDAIDTSLSYLPPNLYHPINARYGLDNPENKLRTLREVRELVHPELRSDEGIRRRIKKALRVLHHPSRSSGIDRFTNPR